MVVEQDFKLWQKAVSFAARQHSGQLRKDGRTPYFAHQAVSVVQELIS